MWKFKRQNAFPKLRHALFAVLFSVTLLFPTMPTRAATDVALAAQAKAAILMDANTGTILFAKNEHQRLPIASVTKVMTMLLAFEAIDRGQVHFTDQIRTSEYAASMGGSQIFLKPGEQMTLRDLLKGIAISSANDAAVAVAEHLAGSEANFVRLMNSRAQALHLKNTHFANTNGLPIADHYSSAYDLAVISRELMKHEQVPQFTGVYSDHLRKHTDRPFWLVNTNKLVRFYQGMDGIKTGYTSEAKYCLAASAKRNHFRVIAVVLGEPTAPVRNAEVTEMMNYAFSHYDIKSVYAKGQVVTLAPVLRGQTQAVGVTPIRPVGILVSKMDHSITGKVTIDLLPLIAPIKKGQVAGYAKIVTNDKVVAAIPLITLSSIEKVSFFEMLGRSLHSLFVLGTKRL
ncbi:D-alanyl-D-alanine carboxypeptidase family protein [Sulfoacidibacillus thermotolerans]|uniref:D-alanyl-D-alanine carboxypeptidase family protein n=1 Tax=Sulfoacidibacillus thermotolerans TaxID=1765684 RepID=UPI001FEBFC9C|nr:D-alanyl-D-alanine carboxypeptidase family protein [Sulfoacidibacillus thermotolerans]